MFKSYVNLKDEIDNCGICGKPNIQLFTSVSCPINHKSFSIRFPDVIKPPEDWKRVRWTYLLGNITTWFTREETEKAHLNDPCPPPGQYLGTGANFIYGVSCGMANIVYSFEE